MMTMKARTLIILAAVAVLTASCGHISRQIKGIITYPTTPEEVADLVAFLVSPKAGYITGNVVSINGGLYT